MSFKFSKTSSLTSESPEALLRDLRSRTIPGLLSHQADILRDYVDSALDKPDVAFQLPTGSGKTLVGLLLGEWRRRKFTETVVYLCSTNQLVHQVAEQANAKYGIGAIPFTGPKAKYDQVSKTDYLNADAIAVTSYSALFNTSPYFDNPNIIILDDAHAAENYVADQWSLRIQRFDELHASLFLAIVSSLRSVISSTDFDRLTNENAPIYEKTWVDKVPTPLFFPLIPEITSIVDAHAKDSELIFPWRLLKDHLFACQLYYSAREILIRPLIPPTSTHVPFTNAKQRVYMSATLSEGGDLERMTGRKNIHRLQVPPGWDKQGIGRRLFIFPERSLSESAQDELVLDMIRDTGRTLVLCTDGRNAGLVQKQIEEQIGCPTFDAKEIESSKNPFISENSAVAIMANRYDGIDFLDDECRLIVVQDLSRATNLQERFIVSKMGAAALLNDRILTRMVQAFGRCTRSATDYAAVVIRGEELTKFIMTRERRTFLHPELQAELEFGIEQSRGLNRSDFLENLKLFLGQGKDWNAADEYIISLRENFSQKQLPGANNLRAIVSNEIEYQTALWQGDFVGAHESARKILAQLTEPELIGYRALWCYLAGSAAWLADRDCAANFETIARDHFSMAFGATSAIRWLGRLSRKQLTGTPTVQEVDADQTIALIERLEVVLDSLGTMHDQKYAKEEKDILDGIAESDKAHFEKAHERLGHLLGFESGNKETTGAPDPWWIIDEELCIIFEDHSNAKENATIDVTKARQAATHPNWVRANLSLAPDARIIPILVTPAVKADTDALPHLKEVYLWPIEDFRKWARNALSIVRTLRQTYPGSGDLAWRATAIEDYHKQQISPRELLKYVTANVAADVLGNT